MSEESKFWYEVTDLDGDERASVQKINLALTQSLEKMSDFGVREQVRYSNEAIERYAQIGLAVDVDWEQVYSPDPNTPAYRPQITILGKLYKHETDYDKLKHDTIQGKIDGVKGVVREDGTYHEEPAKKNIY